MKTILQFIKPYRRLCFFTLLVMVAAGMFYGAGTVLSRTRTIILERERRQTWAQKAALEGKL